MYSLMGAVLAIYLLSTLAGFVAFRKVKPPRKQIFSIIFAFVFASILGAYGLANGGEPKFSNFLQSTVEYGIASIIWLVIRIALFYKKRN